MPSAFELLGRHASAAPPPTGGRPRRSGAPAAPRTSTSGADGAQHFAPGWPGTGVGTPLTIVIDASCGDGRCGGERLRQRVARRARIEPDREARPALTVPTSNDRSVGTSSECVTSPAFTSIGSDVRSFASSTSFCASSTEYRGCDVWLGTSTRTGSVENVTSCSPATTSAVSMPRPGWPATAVSLPVARGRTTARRGPRSSREELVDRRRRDRVVDARPKARRPESETYDQSHRKKRETGKPSWPWSITAATVVPVSTDMPERGRRRGDGDVTSDDRDRDSGVLRRE